MARLYHNGKEEKPKKRGRLSSCALFLLALVIISIGGLILITEEGDQEGVASINLGADSSYEEKVTVLESSVVRRPQVFALYAFVISLDDKIQPGRYRIPYNISIHQLIEMLTVGPSKTEGVITIIEGRTNEEIAEEITVFLAEGRTFAGDETFDASSFHLELVEEMGNLEKYSEEYVFLKEIPQGRTLEGYLFPDTYTFFYTSTPEDIITKMLDNFNIRVNGNIREDARTVDDTLFDTISLASIVQNEAGQSWDFAKIAGVFRNRLETGMELESDATVNYVTGKNDPTPSIDDTRVQSPYNTYQNEGLPYGPVGNPGLEAIKATIHAEEHEFFYFLTDLDTGGAIYSKTYDEHAQNAEIHLR